MYLSGHSLTTLAIITIFSSTLAMQPQLPTTLAQAYSFLQINDYAAPRVLFEVYPRESLQKIIDNFNDKKPLLTTELQRTNSELGTCRRLLPGASNISRYEKFIETKNTAVVSLQEGISALKKLTTFLTMTLETLSDEDIYNKILNTSAFLAPEVIQLCTQNDLVVEDFLQSLQDQLKLLESIFPDYKKERGVI